MGTSFKLICGFQEQAGPVWAASANQLSGSSESSIAKTLMEV
jgi:hypothetical protein